MTEFDIGQLCFNDNSKRPLFRDINDWDVPTEHLKPWQPFLVLEVKKIYEEHTWHYELKILVDEKVGWIYWE